MISYESSRVPPESGIFARDYTLTRPFRDAELAMMVEAPALLMPSYLSHLRQLGSREATVNW